MASMRAIVVNITDTNGKHHSVPFDRYGRNSDLFKDYSKTDEQLRKQAISNAFGACVRQGIDVKDFSVHIVPLH